MTHKVGSPRYTVAELFCGCGGFSHGFKRAGRFDIMLGNDVKKAALRTFRWNHRGEHGDPEILDGDIREIPADEVVAALKRKGVGDGQLDILIGGPPCQGFSQMRRSEERKGSEIVKFKGYNRLDHDSRNDLVLRFLEIAAVLRPKVIVIENVPQMLRHAHNGISGGISAQVQATLLNEMGYDVMVRTLNAADYGVPQLRERVVFIASRVGPVSFPEPTHVNPDQEALLALGKRPWIKVAHALGDLPTPAPGPHDELGGSPLDVYVQDNISEFARSMRSTKTFPYNHLSRKYKTSVLRIIHHMQPGETWDSASERMQQLYMPLIQQHQQPHESLDETIARLDTQGLITAAFFRQYYWSAYTRLDWNRPALTVTANANFLGSGRYTHPDEDRGITMREAARLQSFDDDFRFITSATEDQHTTGIGVGMDMIGEAVPPLLAEALARHIALSLDKYLNNHENEAFMEASMPVAGV